MSEEFDSPEERKDAKAKDKANRIAQLRKDTLKKFMDSPQGRAWFYDLLAELGAYRSVFSTNALTMAMMSGKQDVGHRLLAMLMDSCPGSYMKMLEEANERNG